MPELPARRFAVLLAVLLAALTCVPVADAGLGDSLKKKMDEQRKKAEQAAAAKAAEQATAPAAAEPAGSEAPASAAPEAGQPAAANAAPAPKVSEVSSKFDFVPGDKVIFADDFTQDELGEFPARLKLLQGTFEIAEMDSQRWLRCLSTDGRVRMRLPAAPALPEQWTLEYDLWGQEPMGSAFLLTALGANDEKVWELVFPEGNVLTFHNGDFLSTTPFEPAESIPGRHRLMIMARGRGVKVFLDRQRMASVPEIESPAWPVQALELRLWANSQPMIANLRFAEGPRPPADMLAQGKFVTYGIRFATGSDVVLPESAPVLRQVAAWLTANPAAKLAVTGHTDNVGGAAANLDLSKRRAASVARVLSEQFSVAAARLTTDGKGDTQPVAPNDKPEGRAMNRRVEFAKL